MPTIVLRSLLGRLGVAVVGLIGLYPVAVIWLADGYGHGLQALSAAFAVTVAAWLLWWRPLMRLDQESIRVRNAFRSHRVAWDAVTDVQSRWGLVLVLADAGDDAVHHAGRVRVADVAEAQLVHDRYGPGSHGDNVSHDAAHAGGRPLIRLDEARVIVRLHFERHGPAVADVHDSGVLAHADEQVLAHLGRELAAELLEVDLRGFVRAVL